MTLAQAPLAPHTLASEKARTQLTANTNTHQMSVLLDHPETGHRHLRFARPDSSLWAFDVITWPGRLVFTGDIGHYVFAGIAGDTLAFFGHGADIHPDYWAEKVRAGVARSDFNAVVFEHSVREALEEYRSDLSSTEHDLLVETALEDIGFACDVESARFALDSFYWTNDDGDVRVSLDALDVDMGGYDHFYLLACHALRWAARTFEASK